MSYRAFPAYKESGVPWLGQIPEHWSAWRFSHAVSVNGGQVDPRLAPWSEMTLIAPNHIESGTGRLLATETATEQGADSGKYLVRKGQVIYSKIRPALRKATLAPANCLSSADMYGLHPVAGLMRDRFLLEVVLSEPFTDFVIDASMRVAMPKINREALGAGTVWFPSLEEQDAILGFLDRETAEIDELIAKQNALIALLSERRKAVVSQALTGALKRSDQTKGGETTWVGAIPKTWKVTTVKRFCVVTDCKHLTAEFISDGLPLASIREVKTKYVDLSAAKRTTEAFYEQLIDGHRKPRPGDLIFSRNATVGEVAIVPAQIERFAMGQDVCLLRPIAGRSDSEFVRYLLKSDAVVRQIELETVGSTFNRINVESLRNLIVPLPPVGDQKQIVRSLDYETSSIDSLIDKATAVVGFLRERRSALITAAVTGKIDVREAV